MGLLIFFLLLPRISCETITVKKIRIHCLFCDYNPISGLLDYILPDIQLIYCICILIY